MNLQARRAGSGPLRPETRKRNAPAGDRRQEVPGLWTPTNSDNSSSRKLRGINSRIKFQNNDTCDNAPAELMHTNGDGGPCLRFVHQSRARSYSTVYPQDPAVSSQAPIFHTKALYRGPEGVKVFSFLVKSQHDLVHCLFRCLKLAQAVQTLAQLPAEPWVYTKMDLTTELQYAGVNTSLLSMVGHLTEESAFTWQVPPLNDKSQDRFDHAHRGPQRL